MLLWISLALAPPAAAGDWSNAGGNAARNGQSDEYGPLAAELLWSGSQSSIIAWQPVSAGQRVFAVRQTGFPPAGEPNGSPIVCQDLGTGALLWTTHLPFAPGQWTTWIAGTSNGLLYASRSGNGGSISARLFALDQATGAAVWASAELQKAGAYDGVVFAPDGDPILAWHERIMRIDADTGATVWSTARLGSVSGNCGACVQGDGAYVVDAVVGGHAIKKFDLASGALLYQSGTMIGFTIQNTPLAGPDGTIYVSRTQNNPITDFFYAWKDTGAAFSLTWSLPAAWTTSSEFAVAPDGSAYMLAPGNLVQRVAFDGSILALASSPITTGNAAPRMAVDFDGRLYVSNGTFSDGALFCYEPDLTLRWSTPVPNINIGAPCLAADGTLIVAGVGTDLRAYRTPSPWTDLGLGTAGTLGTPLLTGTGTLTPAHTITLALSNAAPLAPTFLIVGALQVNLPLLGHTLVPSPDFIFPPSLTTPFGTSAFTSPWPLAIPPGTPTYFQHFLLDPTGPSSLTSSNGLLGTAQ